MRRTHTGSKHIIWLISGLITCKLPYSVLATPQTVKGHLSSASSQYDVTLLPIKPEALAKAIVTAGQHDPVEIFQLLRQADQQDQNALAMRALKHLSLEQPKNAIVLASYALSLEMALGWSKSHPKRHVLDYDATQLELTTTIERARQLDPKLWLVYAVAGQQMFHQLPEQYAKGLPLLKKAVALASDVTFTHYLLGKAYILVALLAWSKHKPHDAPFQQAAAELERATQLKPVSADASYNLFNVYDTWILDKAKAKRAATIFVATLPPGSLVGLPARKRLAKYGVKVPW